MKRCFSLLLIGCALLLALPALRAQEDRLHTVQRKETAFGIAKAYGVDLNALFGLNPWAEGGIRKGDVLRIPAPSVPNEARPDAHPQEADSDVERASAATLLVAPSPAVDKPPFEIPRGRPVPPVWASEPIRVAVFLPFFGGRDSLARQEARLREIALDCAAGISLALDSARTLGARFEVGVFDSGTDTSGAPLTTAADLAAWTDHVDLAVGPLKRSLFREVRTWPGVEGAVHLALTDLGVSLTEGCPGVLMPHVQTEDRMAALAQHVAGAHRGEKVLLLATGDIRNIEAESAFREAWNRIAEQDSMLILSEVEVNARGLGFLRDSLTDVRRNILVVPGGKANRSLAGVLQTEMQLGDSLDFLLYTDGEWRDFNFMDAALRERIRFTVADGGGTLPDSSVYGPLDSLHFCLARELTTLRGQHVGEYGWLAHDATRDVMGWMAGFGTAWPAGLAQGSWLMRPVDREASGVYRFDWTPSGGAGDGLRNGAVRILRQEDFQWVEVGRHSVPSEPRARPVER